MWILLIFIFFICIFVAYKIGEQQTELGGAAIVWLFLAPVFTSIVMFGSYYVIYGFNLAIWFMLFPLTFPLFVGIVQKITELEYQHIYKTHTEAIRNIVRSHLATKIGEQSAYDLQINVVYRDIYKQTVLIRKQSKWKLDVWVYPVQNKIKDTLYLNKKELETLVTSSLKERYGEVTFAIKFEYSYLKAQN